jgi:O-antigen/teichoic acid export membrane protein
MTPFYTELAQNFRTSKILRHAIIIFCFNALSRVFSFWGSLHAAHCLGPYNLGVSAMVQSTSQQASLLFNGGFNYSATHLIAANPTVAQRTTAMVVLFRLMVGGILAITWSLVTVNMAPVALWTPWLIGSILIIVNACDLRFVFSGIEKLPLFNGITAFSSVISACAYLTLFKPGAALGSDLVVIAAVGAVSVVMYWTAYRLNFSAWPIFKIQIAELLTLVRNSWRYWITDVAILAFDTAQISTIYLLKGSSEAGVWRAACLMAYSTDLIFAGINSLLLPRLTAWNTASRERLWRNQKMLFVSHSVLGALVTFAFILVLPLIIEHFFSNYAAGIETLCVILLCSRFSVFVGQIYVFALIAVGMDQFLMWLVLISNITFFPLGILLSQRFGLVGFAYALFICQTISHIMCFLAFRSRILKDDRLNSEKMPPQDER